MPFLTIAVILLLAISFISTAKVCPSNGFVVLPTNCTSTCSTRRDRCGTNKKCCYRIAKPCGFHCIKAKHNMKKAGECPTSQSDDRLWSICDFSTCDVDNDCEDTKKCCSNLCGSKICISPK